MTPALITQAWLLVLLAVAIVIVCGAVMEAIVKFIRWCWRHNKDGND